MRSSRRRARDAFVPVANAVLAVVLAPECEACGRAIARPLEGPVCGRCWASIAQLTAHSFQTPLIERGCSAGDYDGALRAIIHALKYDGRRSVARRLGALMGEAGRAEIEGASCAVPVPLHPWRRLRRGFNQASDLAAALGLPVLHALWRRRLTAPQTGLTAGARRRNVRGAIVLAPFLCRRTMRSLIVDRIVVLVDDVRTTGATLDACARVLKDAGAREVRALTVARAEYHAP